MNQNWNKNQVLFSPCNDCAIF